MVNELTCELDGLQENGCFGLRRLVLPNKIDKVLRWIDKLGIGRSNFGVDERRLLMRYHSSIDSDPGVFHSFLINLIRHRADR